MPIKITNTNVAATNAKILIYGPAGIGKTVLCSTLPKNIIISCESGLLSLADKDIDVIEINTIKDLGEAYDYVNTEEMRAKYDNLSLDSITEIAEVLLSKLKAENKDPRAAYGALADQMTKIIRKFRDIEHYNVYFTAKMAKVTDDDTGITTHYPMMPGTQLKQGLSFFFDEVFVMRMGRTEGGTDYRYLQTQPDYQYEAKDRSGKLKNIVKPDLSVVFKKILKQKVGKDADKVIVTEEDQSKLIEVIDNVTKTDTFSDDKESSANEGTEKPAEKVEKEEWEKD